MNALVLFGAFALSFWTVQAQEISILRGDQPQIRVGNAEIAAGIRPGQVLVFGESHGLPSARKAQMDLLEALRARGLKVSVGLEFFYYPDQPLVDAYRMGLMPEKQFLSEVQWGQPSFDFYRDQANFPRLDQDEKTLALNAPRALTKKIAKVGVQGLSDLERSLLPPNFEIGRDSYKKRFFAVSPHFPDPAVGERYFAAQSAWDDTMAWKAAEFSRAHPDQVLAIVVGDFHAQYGGGLPDRLRLRLGAEPVVFSFVNAKGLSEAELQEQVMPSAEFGARADYIWLAAE